LTRIYLAGFSLILFLAACTSPGPSPPLAWQSVPAGGEAKQETAPVRISPGAFLSLPRIKSLAVSADGAHIAVGVRETDWAGDTRRTRIRLYRPDTATLGAPLDLPGPVERFTWSPNGRWLALDMRDGDTGHDQIFLRETESGALHRLTDMAGAVDAVSWGDKGQWLYFLAPNIPQPDNPGAQTATQPVTPYYEARNNRRLWRVPATGGKPSPISPPDISIRAYDITETGAIALRHAPFRHSDALMGSEVLLADGPGEPFIRITQNDHYEHGIVFSPSGRHLAWRAQAGLEGAAYVQENLFLQDLDAREILLTTGAAPFEVERATWLGDGSGLIVETTRGVRSGLVVLDAETGRRVDLARGDYSIVDWRHAPQEGAVYAILRDGASPGELWRIALKGDPPERLTRFGARSVETLPAIEQRIVSWRGADGVRVEGIYVPPLERPDGPAPLLVFPHGGPRLSDRLGDVVWSQAKATPVFASAGYGVLFVNYRGSTGYGDRFLQGMTGTYFRHAHRDVLTGVDALVAEGWADPDELVLMGWSAGGHMVNKLVTVTDRFRAALSGASAVDWASHHLSSDVRGPRRLLFGADPWEPGALERIYWPQSLLSDLHRIRTPILVMAGEDDPRVSPAQSKMLYHALRRQGVDTRLYLFPDTGHGLVRPSHGMFRLNAALDWFARHRGLAPPDWASPPGGTAPAPQR